MKELEADIELLLECLRCQRDNPVALKQALCAIASICETKGAEAKDYLRTCDGLTYILLLLTSVTNTSVRDAAHYTLGCSAEGNVFSQKELSTRQLFTFLHDVVSSKTATSCSLQSATFLILAIVSNNNAGQILVRKSGCLESLLHLFKTCLSLDSVRSSSDSGSPSGNIDLWSSVTSTLGVCVNNPQNDDNQRMVAAVFPHALKLLEDSTEFEVIMHTASLIGIATANNVHNQERIHKCCGLEVLVGCLYRLVNKYSTQPRACETSVQAVIRCIDSVITNYVKNAEAFGRLGGIPILLQLLQENSCPPALKLQCVITLGQATDSCGTNQVELVRNGGVGTLIKELTSARDEELSHAVKYVLQACVNVDTNRNQVKSGTQIQHVQALLGGTRINSKVLSSDRSVKSTKHQKGKPLGRESSQLQENLTQDLDQLEARVRSSPEFTDHTVLALYNQEITRKLDLLEKKLDQSVSSPGPESTHTINQAPKIMTSQGLESSHARNQASKITTTMQEKSVPQHQMHFTNGLAAMNIGTESPQVTRGPGLLIDTRQTQSVDHNQNTMVYSHCCDPATGSAYPMAASLNRKTQADALNDYPMSASLMRTTQASVLSDTYMRNSKQCRCSHDVVPTPTKSKIDCPHTRSFPCSVSPEAAGEKCSHTVTQPVANVTSTPSGYCERCDADRPRANSSDSLFNSKQARIQDRESGCHHCNHSDKNVQSHQANRLTSRETHTEGITTPSEEDIFASDPKDIPCNDEHNISETIPLKDVPLQRKSNKPKKRSIDLRNSKTPDLSDLRHSLSKVTNSAEKQSASKTQSSESSVGIQTPLRMVTHSTQTPKMPENRIIPSDPDRSITARSTCSTQTDMESHSSKSQARRTETPQRKKNTRYASPVSVVSDAEELLQELDRQSQKQLTKDREKPSTWEEPLSKEKADFHKSNNPCSTDSSEKKRPRLEAKSPDDVFLKPVGVPLSMYRIRKKTHAKNQHAPEMDPDDDNMSVCESEFDSDLLQNARSQSIGNSTQLGRSVTPRIGVPRARTPLCVTPRRSSWPQMTPDVPVVKAHRRSVSDLSRIMSWNTSGASQTDVTEDEEGTPASPAEITSNTPAKSTEGCPGCQTSEVCEVPLLNSRTYNIALETCSFTCKDHRFIRETERKFIHKVKSLNAVSQQKGPLMIRRPAKHDGSGDHGNKEDEDVYDFVSSSDSSLENRQLTPTYSSENDLTGPVTNFLVKSSSYTAQAKKSEERRTRIPYTSEEVESLIEGVNKQGHSWVRILQSYEFHPTRTAVDLKDKYKRMMAKSRSDVTVTIRSATRSGKPFSMAEERRLRRGIRLFGYNWKVILSQYQFVKGRTAEELRDKWRSLNTCRNKNN